MRNALWIAVLVAGWIQLHPVSANGGEKEEAAALVLKLMNVETLFSKSIDNMVDVQIGQNPKLMPLRSPLTAFFARHMSWESLAAEVTELVADEYSTEELRQIAEFYTTPAGQKALQLPRVIARGAEIGARRAKENKADLEAILTERIKELRRQAEEAEETESED